MNLNLKSVYHDKKKVTMTDFFPGHGQGSGNSKWGKVDLMDFVDIMDL